MKRATGYLMGLTFGIVAGTAQADPAWSDRDYSLYLSDQPVNEVIRDLATREGIPVSVDPAATDTVNARFQQMRAVDVFETLVEAYNLQWHFDGHVLYVEPVESAVTRTIELNSVPVSAFRAKLEQMGVFDERFHWGAMEGAGVVVVSGPERYVERISELAQVVDGRGQKFDSVYQWVDEHGQTHISSFTPPASVEANVVQVPRHGVSEANGAGDEMIRGSAQSHEASQISVDLPQGREAR